jgi:hypothetical protein
MEFYRNCGLLRQCNWRETLHAYVDVFRDKLPALQFIGVDGWYQRIRVDMTMTGNDVCLLRFLCGEIYQRAFVKAP